MPSSLSPKHQRPGGLRVAGALRRPAGRALCGNARRRANLADTCLM